MSACWNSLEIMDPLQNTYLKKILVIIGKCGSKFYERLDSDKNWTNFEYIFSEFKTENIKFLPIFFCCKMGPCFPITPLFYIGLTVGAKKLTRRTRVMNLLPIFS